MSVNVGLIGTASMVVTAADTAVALGSGSVQVLGTPRVVALCEEATCVAVAAHLPEGSTTVGTRVVLDHLRPTLVGDAVVATATLDSVEGRRLMFTVSAADTKGQVAVGTVTRVVVEVDRFMKSAQ